MWVILHHVTVYEKAALWLSLRISHACEVVAMTLEFSLCAVAFYDFFYEANCERLSFSVEKMCRVQLQRSQKAECHVVELVCVK